MTAGDSNRLPLLLAAMAGICLFVLAEKKCASPMIVMSIFRNKTLTAGFVTNMLVTTVVMASLVVGPFFLTGALSLDSGTLGLVMSSGPVVAALAGIPAGRLVDRFGAYKTIIAGLSAMIAGTFGFSMIDLGFGIVGYIVPLALLTAGYALFQTANNTAVMKNVDADRRSLVSGMLNLSRNLGLITGASVMGAIFAAATATKLMAEADSHAVVAGMRMTFLVALALVLLASGIAVAVRKKLVRDPSGDVERILIRRNG